MHIFALISSVAQRISHSRVKNQQIISKFVNVILILALIAPMLISPMPISANNVKERPDIQNSQPKSIVELNNFQSPVFSHQTPRFAEVQSLQTTNPFDNGVVYVANKSQLGRTTDFYSTNPTWENISPSISGDIYDFRLHPFDPFNTAFITTNTSVYKTTNLSASPPSWAEVLNDSSYPDMVFYRIEFVADGSRLIVTTETTGYYISDDFGASWEWKNIVLDGGQFYYDPVISTGIDVTDDNKVIISGTAPGGDWSLTSYNDGDSWGIRGHHDVYYKCQVPMIAYAPNIDDEAWTINTNGFFCKHDMDQYIATPVQENPYPSISNKGYDSVGIYGGMTYMVKSSPMQGEVIVYDGSGYSSLTQYPVEIRIPAGLPFGGVNASGLLISPNGSDMGWAALYAPPPPYDPLHPEPTHIIVSSSDGGQTWADATGNWTTAIGTWEGASWGSGGAGNVYLRSPSFVSAKYNDLHGTGPNCNSFIQHSDCGTQGLVGNPINTRTGNNSHLETDFSINAPGYELEFTRAYSTFNAAENALGTLEPGILSAGWYHNYEIQLLIDGKAGSPRGEIALLDPGGSRFSFNELSDGYYAPEPGLGGTLTFDSTAQEYAYRNNQGAGYDFNNDGYLIRVINENGLVTDVTYNANGQIDRVANSAVS